MQKTEPLLAAYDPAGQAVHALAPAVDEYLPTAQGRHVVLEVAPVAVLYVPHGQDRQPVPVAEYVPAGPAKPIT